MDCSNSHQIELESTRNLGGYESLRIYEVIEGEIDYKSLSIYEVIESETEMGITLIGQKNLNNKGNQVVNPNLEEDDVIVKKPKVDSSLIVYARKDYGRVSKSNLKRKDSDRLGWKEYKEHVIKVILSFHPFDDRKKKKKTGN